MCWCYAMYLLLKDIGLQFKLLNFVKKCMLYAKIMSSQKSFEQITCLSLP